jgi:tape measure domain-containing protein
MPDAARLQVKVEADTSAAEQGLKTLGQQVNSFGESVRAGLGIGAGIAAFQEGLRLLEGGFGALKSSVLDFNQTLDMAHTTFLRYFQGNQKAADDFLVTLKQFANVTPFEFKDLVPLAVKLQNANVNAQDIIPTLKAIGEASSATGQISSVSIDRIGLALTQMNQTGHVTGQDMRQLTEALVPAWDILAQATGKPIPVLQKLASQGQISSEVFLDAFRKYYEGTNLMEAASKTLGGALSTIRDVGTQAFADMGRSIYDLATAGANQLATFLQSDDFKAWLEVGKAAVSGMVDAFKGFLAFLEPLTTGIGEAFKRATAGDFSGALEALTNGVKAQLGIIWDTVTAFASKMVGAGSNLIQSFADGMLAGGYAAIQNAMDVITSFIASVLIGNSPPPAGPLAQLDVGGANAAKSWAEPFGLVLKAGVGTAVQAAAGTINQLKDAAIGVSGQIRDVTDRMQAVDAAMRPIKDSIDQIKAGFAAQKQAIQDMADATRDRYATTIQAVRDQIDTIKTAHQQAADAVQKQIDDIKDRYGNDIEAVKEVIGSIKDAYGEAEGAIQRQIDLLKDTYTSAIDGVRNQIARITDAEQAQLAPLERQLQMMRDANTFLKERQDAERSIANAKTQQLQLEALGDPALRAQLAGQLAGLNVQQQRVDLAEQLAEAQKKLSEAGLSPLERQSLQLKIQQLEIQQKLAAMVDTTRLAEATRQSELESAQEKQLATTRAITEAQQKLQEIPVEQNIAKIKAAAESALEPLQRSLKGLENEQKQALDPLQTRLRNLKAEEQGLLQPLQSRLHDLEFDQRNALEPLQRRLADIKRDEKDALAPLDAQLKGLQRESDLWSRVFGAALKDVDRQQREAVGPLQQQLDLYQHQKDALTEQKQELDGIKARIQEAIQLQQQAEREAKAAAGNVPNAPVNRTFTADPTAGLNAEAVKARGQELAKNLSDGIGGWFEAHKTELAERILGAGLGLLIGGPLGALVGAAFLPEFVKKLNEKLKERGVDAQPFIDAFGESLHTGDYSKPAFEIASGITFAITRLPWTISKAIWGAISSAWSNDTGDTNSVARSILSGIGDGIKRMVIADLIDLGAVARGIFVGVGDALRTMTAEISKESAIVGTAIWDGVIAGLRAGFVAVGDFLRLTIGMLTGIFEMMLGIASPSTVFHEYGVDIMDGLLHGLTQKWEDLKQWWTNLPGNIQTAFGWSGGGFTWVADLKAMGSKLLENVWDGLDDYWTQFSQWWTDLPGHIQEAFGWAGGALAWVADLKAIGSKILENIWDGLNSYWVQFSKWWADLPKNIQAAFGWTGNALTWAADLLAAGKAILAGLWSGHRRLLAQQPSALVAEPQELDLHGARTRLPAYAGGAVDWLKEVGRQVLTSFWNGLNELWGNEGDANTVKGLLKTITDWIPQWIKDALGVHSPSQVMHGIGHNTMQGLIDGLRVEVPGPPDHDQARR